MLSPRQSPLRPQAAFDPTGVNDAQLTSRSACAVPGYTGAVIGLGLAINSEEGDKCIAASNGVGNRSYQVWLVQVLTYMVYVCNMLLQDGAIVNVYDPKVKKEDALTEFKYHNMTVDESRFVFHNSAAEAVDGAHALVILTEWDEFKTLPYHEFYATMMKPAFVFDGRSILNHAMLEDMGFEVHAIGKGRGPDGKLRVFKQEPQEVVSAINTALA